MVTQGPLQSSSSGAADDDGRSSSRIGGVNVVSAIGRGFWRGVGRLRRSTLVMEVAALAVTVRPCARFGVSTRILG